MNPKDLLDRLPSVTELVDHPEVRRVAERWNRTWVAGRLRTALDELGAEAARRADSLRDIPPADLVDRLVRRIDQSAPPAEPTVVNATGELWGEELVGPPLPNAAITAADPFAANYSLRSGDATTRIARLVGAEAAWVAVNHAAAVGATLAALSADSPVVVARGDVRRLPGGLALTDICATFGSRLHEVGVADGATLDDYLKAVDATGGKAPRPKVVLYRSDAGETAGQGVATSDLAAALRQRGALLVVDAGLAPPIDVDDAFGASAPSAAALLAGGADAVVLRGDGLLGGPSCSLVIGRRSAVDAVAGHALGRLTQADAITRAMLAGGAALFESPDRLRFDHPLYELLSAPLDNLRTRAERLAPQIDATPHGDAEPIELDAGPANRPVRLASWGIAVKPTEGDCASLRKRLAEQELPIACREQNDRVVLDLRTVFPRDDGALVAAFPGSIG